MFQHDMTTDAHPGALTQANEGDWETVASRALFWSGSPPATAQQK